MPSPCTHQQIEITCSLSSYVEGVWAIGLRSGVSRAQRQRSDVGYISTSSICVRLTRLITPSALVHCTSANTFFGFQHSKLQKIGHLTVVHAFYEHVLAACLQPCGLEPDTQSGCFS
eukprot:722218-Amphidinium_carterae.1